MGLLSLPFLKPKDHSKRHSKDVTYSSAAPPVIPAPVFQYKSLCPSVLLGSDNGHGEHDPGHQPQRPQPEPTDPAAQGNEASNPSDSQPGLPGVGKAPCNDLSRYPLLQPLAPPVPLKDGFVELPAQAPHGYLPFQTGVDYFRKSEGSGDQSVFPDAKHFPFIPSTAFQPLFDGQPDYPPHSLPQPQRQAPAPPHFQKEPQTRVFPALARSTRGLFNRHSQDMDQDAGDEKTRRGRSKEKERGRSREQLDRSRFSVPPGGIMPQTFPASHTRHSTPPVATNLDDLKFRSTPPARRKVLPWVREVAKDGQEHFEVATITSKLTDTPFSMHNPATGTRANTPQPETFKFRTADGAEMSVEEKHRRYAEEMERLKRIRESTYRGQHNVDFGDLFERRNVDNVEPSSVPHPQPIPVPQSANDAFAKLYDGTAGGGQNPIPAPVARANPIPKVKSKLARHTQATRDSSLESPKGGKYRVTLKDRNDPVAEALAKLEATVDPSTQIRPVVPYSGAHGGLKGQRLTFETLATSTTPSFGHIYHQDGKPIAIPHNPPLMPSGTIPQAAVGGVFNISLLAIGEVTERGSSVDRSAYVETVEDEQAAELGLSTVRSKQESTFNLAEWLQQVQDASTSTSGLARHTSTSHNSSEVISQLEEAIQELQSASESAAKSSVALTTTTQVKQMVSNSSFHDETLCQLLDAARLNLIGEEAKRALMRAARSRVMELRDLKVHGEKLEEGAAVTAPLNIQKRGKRNKDVKKDTEQQPSNAQQRARNVSDSTVKASAAKAPGPVVVAEATVEEQPASTPRWATEILNRLSAFDARLAEMEKPDSPTTMTQPTMAPQESSYAEMPRFGGYRGFSPGPGFATSPVPENLPEEGPRFAGHYGFPPGYPSVPVQEHFQGEGPTFDGYHRFTPGYQPIYHPRETYIPPGSIHTIPTTMTASPPPAPATQTQHSRRPSPIPKICVHTSTPPVQGTSQRSAPMDTFGDQPDTEQTPPANIMPSGPPRIMIQSATRTNSEYAPTPRAFSCNTTTAGGSPQEAVSPESSDPKAAEQPPAPDLQRDLPPLPKDEASAVGSTQVPGTAPAIARDTSRPPTPQASVKPPAVPPPVVPPPAARAVSSVVDKAAVPAAETVHKITIIDPTSPPFPSPAPWDTITQKLYSWVMVWEEDSLQRALAAISINQEVGEIPLTVFVMKTLRRTLRYRLTNTPPLPCDKLYIPPNIAETINKAVFAQRYDDARILLQETWNDYGFNHAPRIIITLSKQGNHDLWQATRYDLATKRLTTYLVGHEIQTVPDSRTFFWWHAISKAWPEYTIADVDSLQHTFKTLPTYAHNKENNSIRAAVVTRNLLLGTRPETEHDLAKVRDYIWQEVKQLLVQKRQGTLMVGKKVDKPAK